MTQQIKNIYSTLFSLKSSYISISETYISNVHLIESLQLDKDERTKELMIANMKSHQLITKITFWLSPGKKRAFFEKKAELEKALDSCDTHLEFLAQSNFTLLTKMNDLVTEMTQTKNAIIKKSQKVNDYVARCANHKTLETATDFVMDFSTEKPELAFIFSNENLLAECDYILTYISKIIKRNTVVPNKLFEKLVAQNEVLPSIVQTTRGIKVVNQ